MATNLQFIKEVSISASTSSTSVDNVFSSDYDVYCIVCRGFSTVGTSGTFLGVRFIDNSGNVVTDAEYDWADLEMRSDASFSDDNDEGATFMRLQGGFDQEPETTGAVIYVYNPSDSGSYTFITTQSGGITGGYNRGGKGIGVHKTAETIRGFAIIETVASRPYDSGNISVYGVK